MDYFCRRKWKIIAYLLKEYWFNYYLFENDRLKQTSSWSSPLIELWYTLSNQLNVFICYKVWWNVLYIKLCYHAGSLNSLCLHLYSYGVLTTMYMKRIILYITVKFLTNHFFKISFNLALAKTNFVLCLLALCISQVRALTTHYFYHSVTNILFNIFKKTWWPWSFLF